MGQELERYVRAARDAGCEMDQVRRFIDARYVALPWALGAHAAARRADSEDGPYWIALGGARGPGKSHALLAQAAIDDCQRQPGLKYLFLRKLQRSAVESLDDLVRRVLGGINYNFKVSSGLLEVGGSRIIVGGYHHSRDILRYIGIEYDGMVIEECTQITEEEMVAIRGSIRSSIPGWRTRVYLSTNPGGVGHRWFKRHFVNRNDPKFIGGLTTFWPGTYRDNPFLSKDYIEYLQSLKGPLGAAWRDGNWDQFEGIAFPDWDGSRHICEPFEIPSHWMRWRAIDWGYAAPFVCLWLAKDPDIGRVYVYREYSATQLTDRQQAQIILDMTPPDENIRINYADPSMWAKRSAGDEILSTADEYRSVGVELTRADNDRIIGKQRIHRLLANLPDGKPGLMVFNTCVGLIETMENVPSDPNHPEDIDTNADDHHVDALKYALTNYEHRKNRDHQGGNAKINEMYNVLRRIF